MWDDADEIDRLGLMPLGDSFMVQRTQMIRDLVLQGRRAGIVVIYAPDGFGKTAVMLQYVEEVRSDPTRGEVRVIEAERAVAPELYMQLEVLTEELRDKPRSLIAIDNVPVLDDGETDELISRIRMLRGCGVGVLLTCKPVSDKLILGLGDSVKVNAQMLRVRAHEFSDWAKTLSISTSLDIYGLTQGVPELVSTLQASANYPGGAGELLEKAVVEIYGELLADLAAHGAPAFYSLVCLMLLMGHGNLSDLERCGVRVTSAERASLAREYPVFGYEPADDSFCCLGRDNDAQMRIRRTVSGIRPDLVQRAARIQIRSGRCDRAMMLIEEHLGYEAAMELVAQYAAPLVLSGHGAAICRIATEMADQLGERKLDASAALGVYMAALTVGNMRLAKRMGELLKACEAALPQQIDPETWNVAHVLSDLLVMGVPSPLPAIKVGAAIEPGPFDELLRIHRDARRDLIEGKGSTRHLAHAPHISSFEGAVNIPWTLVECDKMLAEVLDGSLVELDERDELMSGQLPALAERGLRPVAMWTKAVLETRRLLCGLPMTDEEAFCEVTRHAVQARDIALQFFCTVMEGWQFLVKGQPINAKFRAVQALRLAGDHESFVRDVACLLERASALRNTSLVTVRNEADVLDLERTGISPCEAWGCALHLACAGHDTDLAAWMSLNRAVLLTPSYRLFARLAMHCLGESSDLVRRKLPAHLIAHYALKNDAEAQGERLFDVEQPTVNDLSTRVELRLFGGFRAERDGQPLPGKAWRRRKAEVLAARLALGTDALVEREILEQELWPEADPQCARNNLYSIISALRKALGPTPDGHSCVIVRPEGLGLNGDYVFTDIHRFDQISREILVKKNGASGPHLVELCLKLEQVYVGPLYAPPGCAPACFKRMRRVLQSKFIDCMIKGSLVAMEENDLQSAVWLAESGLRQDATREDMLRTGMRVYDVAGRRREIVDLYSAHLGMFKGQIGAVPEPETRRLYERLVEGRYSTLLG